MSGLRTSINKYEALDGQYAENEDFESIALDVIEKAERGGVQIEPDPASLKGMMSTDLRDNVPPQLFFVVSGIIDIIDKIENE